MFIIVAGTHDIPVDQLRDSPAYMKVRDVKDWYVNYLADELRKDNHDLEELTAPLLVVASTTKEDYRTKDMSSYTFEVIGGVHWFLAILKIHKDDKKKARQQEVCHLWHWIESKCHPPTCKPAQ